MTKAGINEIKITLVDTDESGKGNIVIAQSYPCVGDMVYHEQKMFVKLLALTADGKLQTHTQDLHLLAQAETEI